MKIKFFTFLFFLLIIDTQCFTAKTNRSHLKKPTTKINSVDVAQNALKEQDHIASSIVFTADMPTTSINEKIIDQIYGLTGLNIAPESLRAIKCSYCYLEFLVKLDKVKTDTSLSQYKADFKNFLQPNQNNTPLMPTANLVGSKGWQAIHITAQDIVTSQAWQLFSKAMICDTLSNDDEFIIDIAQADDQLFTYIPNIEQAYSDDTFTKFRLYEESLLLQALIQSEQQQKYLAQCADWKNLSVAKMNDSMNQFKKTDFYNYTHNAQATQPTKNQKTNAASQVVIPSPLREHILCYYMLIHIQMTMQDLIMQSNTPSMLTQVSSSQFVPNFILYDASDYIYINDLATLKTLNDDNKAEPKKTLLPMQMPSSNAQLMQNASASTATLTSPSAPIPTDPEQLTASIFAQLPTTSIYETIVDQIYGISGLNIDTNQLENIKKTYCYLEYLVKVNKVRNDPAFAQYQQAAFKDYVQTKVTKLRMPTQALVSSDAWKQIPITQDEIVASPGWQNFIKSMICDIHDQQQDFIIDSTEANHQLFPYLPNIESAYITNDFTSMRLYTESIQLNALIQTNQKQQYLQQCVDWKTINPTKIDEQIVAFKNTDFYKYTHNAPSKKHPQATASFVTSELITGYLLLAVIQKNIYDMLTLNNLMYFLNQTEASKIIPNFFTYNSADYIYLYDYLSLTALIKQNIKNPVKTTVTMAPTDTSSVTIQNIKNSDEDYDEPTNDVIIQKVKSLKALNRQSARAFKKAFDPNKNGYNKAMSSMVSAIGKFSDHLATGLIEMSAGIVWISCSFAAAFPDSPVDADKETARSKAKMNAHKNEISLALGTIMMVVGTFVSGGVMLPLLISSAVTDKRASAATMKVMMPIMGPIMEALEFVTDAFTTGFIEWASLQVQFYCTIGHLFNPKIDPIAEKNKVKAKLEKNRSTINIVMSIVVTIIITVVVMMLTAGAGAAYIMYLESAAATTEATAVAAATAATAAETSAATYSMMSIGIADEAIVTTTQVSLNAAAIAARATATTAYEAAQVARAALTAAQISTAAGGAGAVGQTAGQTTGKTALQTGTKEVAVTTTEQTIAKTAVKTGTQEVVATTAEQTAGKTIVQTAAKTGTQEGTSVASTQAQTASTKLSYLDRARQFTGLSTSVEKQGAQTAGTKLSYTDRARQLVGLSTSAEKQAAQDAARITVHRELAIASDNLTQKQILENSAKKTLEGFAQGSDEALAAQKNLAQATLERQLAETQVKQTSQSIAKLGGNRYQQAADQASAKLIMKQDAETAAMIAVENNEPGAGQALAKAVAERQLAEIEAQQATHVAEAAAKEASRLAARSSWEIGKESNSLSNAMLTAAKQGTMNLGFVIGQALNAGFGVFSVMAAMDQDEAAADALNQERKSIQSLWAFIEDNKVNLTQSQHLYMSELRKKHQAAVGNQAFGLQYYTNFLNSSIHNVQTQIAQALAQQYIQMLTPDENGLRIADIGASWGLQTQFNSLYPSQGFITTTLGRPEFPYAQEVAQAPLASETHSTNDSSSDKTSLNLSDNQPAATKLWFNQRAVSVIKQSVDKPLNVEIKFRILYNLNTAYHVGLYLGGNYHDYNSAAYLQSLQDKGSIDLNDAHLAKMFVVKRDDAKSAPSIGLYENEGLGWIAQQAIDANILNSASVYHMKAILNKNTLTVSFWPEDNLAAKWTKTIKVTPCDQRTFGVIFSGIAIEWNVVQPTMPITQNKSARIASNGQSEAARSRASKSQRKQLLTSQRGSMNTTLPVTEKIQIGLSSSAPSKIITTQSSISKLQSSAAGTATVEFGGMGSVGSEITPIEFGDMGAVELGFDDDMQPTQNAINQTQDSEIAPVEFGDMGTVGLGFSDDNNITSAQPYETEQDITEPDVTESYEMEENEAKSDEPVSIEIPTTIDYSQFGLVGNSGFSL
ncbi:MAG: hypothetical protein Q8Q60_01230 [Candidatus Chromulinivorax sp.]|nr:hypothetical protein [Candidatus Chromulinivorax sp.]